MQYEDLLESHRVTVPTSFDQTQSIGYLEESPPNCNGFKGSRYEIAGERLFRRPPCCHCRTTTLNIPLDFPRTVQCLHMRCTPGAIKVPILSGMRLRGTGTFFKGIATVRNTFPGRPVHTRPFVPRPLSCSRAATATTSLSLSPYQDTGGRRGRARGRVMRGSFITSHLVRPEGILLV